MAEQDGQQQQQGQQGQQQTLILNKYADQAAFETGIRELAKKVEYPIDEDTPIIGEGGMFRDLKHAEAGYKAFARLQTRAGGQQQQQQGDQNQQQQQQQQSQQRNADGTFMKKPGDDAALQIANPPAVADDVDTAAVLAKAGLKAEDVSKQWTETGSLSDEQYAAIQATLPGVSKAMINSYMASQQVAGQAMQQQQQAIRADAIQIAGGEQQLNNLLATARTFVPKDELDGLNAMLADPKQYKIALRVIMEHHRQSVGAGKSRPLVQGDARGSDAPLRRGTREYYDAIRAAGRGDQVAKQRLAQLVQS